ncbi:MAG: amino acid ABC transporter permease [Pseudomonadota bacterium]|nr:amino acid ABC transporter permease [Pseudomonadota bacterium]
MDAVADFFRWLNDVYGVNVSIFYDPFDRSRFMTGLWTTTYLSVVCIVASLVIGLVGAWAQGARLRIVRALVQGYVQLFRNTPPLVQLLFFYFAIGTGLPALLQAGGTPEPLLSNIGWAIVSFSLFAGAFNVEIFRSGIEAVPATTREAAESLGYSRLGAYVHIVLPLAFRISLPALNNNLVNLVKTTTLAYAIAVPELLYASAQVWSEVLNVREMMNMLLVCYIGLVGVLVLVMSRIERALRIPGYSA